MKKKFLAIAAIAIMIPLVLCACKKEKPVKPTQPATQEASVEPETKSAPTEDPQAAVIRLIDNVNVLKYVHGVALDYDDNYVWYDENGYAYFFIESTDGMSFEFVVGEGMRIQQLRVYMENESGELKLWSYVDYDVGSAWEIPEIVLDAMEREFGSSDN